MLHISSVCSYLLLDASTCRATVYELLSKVHDFRCGGQQMTSVPVVLEH